MGIEIELIKGLVGNGAVAILAGLIFLLARADRSNTEKMWKEHCENDVKCREDANRVNEKLASALYDLVVAIRSNPK